MAITMGSIVSSSLAAKVLAAAGIPAEQIGIGPDGEAFEYGGKVYYIMEREVWFPPSETSPDGWHIIYSPSDEEEAERKPEDTTTINETINKVLNVAMWGIGAYILVNLISGYKVYKS